MSCKRLRSWSEHQSSKLSILNLYELVSSTHILLSWLIGGMIIPVVGVGYNVAKLIVFMVRYNDVRCCKV